MITLTTTLYDGNYEQFLTEEYSNWFHTFTNKQITKKTLIVNNLSNKDRFYFLLDKIHRKYSVKYDLIFVEEYAKDAINHFKLDINESSLGYYYSIQYFVALLKVNTPYILNVSTDCMVDINVNDIFFEKSINLFENTEYPISFIPWSKHWKTYGYPEGLGELGKSVSCVAEWEQIHAVKFPNKEFLKDFWCGHVVTDQVFFADVNKLKIVDFNPSKGSCYIHSRSPYAGDDAFEVKMSDYLFYNHIYKAVLKTEDQYFIHSGSIPGKNIK
jgi:hypothetical protein